MGTDCIVTVQSWSWKRNRIESNQFSTHMRIILNAHAKAITKEVSDKVWRIECCWSNRGEPEMAGRCACDSLDSLLLSLCRLPCRCRPRAFTSHQNPTQHRAHSLHISLHHLYYRGFSVSGLCFVATTSTCSSVVTI